MNLRFLAILLSVWLPASGVGAVVLSNSHLPKEEIISDAEKVRRAVALEAAKEAEASPKVLILGIDGCRPGALLRAETPNLDALIAEGAVSYTAQTGDLTMSGPGWSSLLTGVWRRKHKVNDNSFKGARFDRYPHFFTRLAEVRPEAVTASVVHWKPLHRTLLSNADIASVHESDEEVTRAAIEALGNPELDVLFVHFDDVDHAGHETGFGTPVYLEALEGVDLMVGKILAVLRAREDHESEDWLIIVTTDHGGSGKGHGGRNKVLHKTTFLIVSGDKARRGDITPPPFIVDVVPTVFEHMGLDVDPEWGWDGRSVGLK